MSTQVPGVEGVEGRSVKCSYLGSAAAALLLMAIALFWGVLFAHRVENRYIHALAPRHFAHKNVGIAVGRAAFRQSDLLPLYGASEIWASSQGKPELNRYRASLRFWSYPTGFRVFAVGKGATTALTMLQELTAIGPELRGKKVVLSFTWGPFQAGMAGPDAYGGNFSGLQAGESVFSTDLSPGLKQAVARRMLEYPLTLEHRPVLKFALERLAGGGPVNRALYYAVLPLGKLQDLVLRLQDHWETLAYIRAQHDLRPQVAHHASSIDWRKLAMRAEEDYREVANNNPFGFANERWEKNSKEWIQRQGENSDAVFLRTLRDSKEWVDLGLLLRVLKERGAQPLILCPPLPGEYFNYWGVSASARRVFYTRLREAAEAFGVPLANFEAHDGDKYFVLDFGSHLSPKGWVYYDQALDALYHGRFGELDLDRLGTEARSSRSQFDVSTDKQELEYQQLVKRVRQAAQAASPPKATVIVVSDGEDELLQMGDRKGWHFPQTDDGTYAGHKPADSTEAIGHLEALRAKGASFIVFPNTTFWWLDYYAEFRRHLESHYRVVARHEDSCLIFDLRQPAIAQREH